MGARDLLADATRAGLSVTAEAGRLVIRPASLLTPGMREALRACKPEVLALLTQADGLAVQPCSPDAPAPTADPDPPPEAPPAHSAATLARLQRFQRRGFDLAASEGMAARLVLRDNDLCRHALCLECAHLAGAVGAGWRCARPRAAKVAAQLPPVFVVQLQRCPGFQPAPWCASL